MAAARTVDAQLYEGDAFTPTQDALALEAILQIRVNGTPYTTTVRTPGDDEVLARGLLFSEGLITAPAAPCVFEGIVDPENGLVGALDVLIAPEILGRSIDDRRSLAATASCGLCGVRDAADLILRGSTLRVDSSESLNLALLGTMVAEMAARQATFQATGGCHAAAAFTLRGEILQVYEDIGRHNAVDKVIGALLLDDALARAQVLLVSGRLSYEIVFKAYHARIPFLVSVSAPSSLAVEMARQFGLTLIAFCRPPRSTVYSHPERCY